MPALFGRSMRETIELRLAAVLRRSLPWLRAVRPYNGELEGDEGIEQMRVAVGGKTPAVLVATGDASNTSENVSRRRYEETIAIQLYLCSTNYRGRAAAMLGDDRVQLGEDPGIYRLDEDVRNALAGNDLDLEGLGPLTPRAAAVVEHSPSFSVWILAFAASIDRLIPDRALAGAVGIEEIQANVRIGETENQLLSNGSSTPGAELVALDGFVTLTDPSQSWTSAIVGLEVEISGANLPANDGVFVIESVPTPTTLRFPNRFAASENPFLGAWAVRVLPPVVLAVPVEEITP